MKESRVLLMILDGWGKSKNPKTSAIDNANTQFIDSLYEKYPNANLKTDGIEVGLPDGQMGNSEVGHLNLGAWNSTAVNTILLLIDGVSRELVESRVLSI